MVMAHVSRPLIGLLVSAVAFFAVWTIALKPSSSSSGGANNPTSGAYQSAIAQAHQAVTTSAKGGAADGAPVTSTPSSNTPSATTPATTAPKATTSTATKAHTTAAAGATKATKVTTAPKVTTTTKAAGVSAATRRVNSVTSALHAHKVVALLFYNGAAADDQAVETELAAASVNKAQVVKLEVPVTELSRYPFITNQVQVNSSPTLVLIDRSGQATTIVGFADRFEIAQRIADTLALPRT
jgi:hypothetical protein